MDDMQRFRREIEAHAPMDEGQVLQELVRRHAASAEYWNMLKGQSYYRGENDVTRKARQVIGENGALTGAQNIADNRLSHAFVKELVDQKVQYLLGKPYSLVIDGSEDYKRQAKEVFGGDKFRHLVQRIAKEAIVKGVAWVQPFFDESAPLSFRLIPSERVIPQWADDEHTKLDAVAVLYTREEYEGKVPRLARYAQYYDKDGVRVYKLDSGRPELVQSGYHVMLRDEGVNFSRLPFVRFTYNDEQLPLLNFVKSLVDDYDKIASMDSNALEDAPNSILVLRNYDGQRLDEFRRNLAAYRAVKVTDDGGVESLSTPTDTASSNAHLERLRKDIYAFGRGVDVRGDRQRSSASGVALRHEYAALDMDCNSLEWGLREGLDGLIWFADMYCLMRFCAFGEVDFEFNRDIIVNEEEAVSLCSASEGLLSRRTILANHPWVKDVEEEMKYDARRIDKTDGTDATGEAGGNTRTV